MCVCVCVCVSVCVCDFFFACGFEGAFVFLRGRSSNVQRGFNPKKRQQRNIEAEVPSTVVLRCAECMDYLPTLGH